MTMQSPPPENQEDQSILSSASAVPPPSTGFLPYQGQGVMVTTQAIDILKHTWVWVRFMSVMCFIGTGLMMVAGLFLVLGAAINSRRVDPGMIAVGIIYIPFGLLYIIPGVYLHRYASGITRLTQTSEPVALEGALDAQRSFWKFVGIMTITVMVLYAVFIAVFAVFMMYTMHSKTMLPTPAP